MSKSNLNYVLNSNNKYESLSEIGVKGLTIKELDQIIINVIGYNLRGNVNKINLTLY